VQLQLYYSFSLKISLSPKYTMENSTRPSLDETNATRLKSFSKKRKTRFRESGYIVIHSEISKYLRHWGNIYVEVVELQCRRLWENITR
jgi:Trm5-related predicted tRNA methylase